MIEFESSEVAEIVCESFNDYYLEGRVLKCIEFLLFLGEISHKENVYFPNSYRIKDLFKRQLNKS